METLTISGRYKILSELGKGGFGQTFLAEDLHLPTKPKCVVKQLKPDFEGEDALKLARRLFEQEAEVLYRLGVHPYIPKLLAHFEENGEFYLVQELIEGYTLAQELASGKRFNETETVELLGQLLETLSFVHAQGVIHRDIKPSNIIHRFSDGRFYLIDFGAVKQVKINARNQDPTFRSTIAVGSEGYMPSEQIAGKPRFSSDLYALGLVGVEALTGLHPLRLVQNQNSGEFTWQHKVQLHREVEQFITKITRYDFRQRYNSATEAFSALKVVAVSSGLGQKKNAVMKPMIDAPRPPQEVIYTPPPPTIPPTQAAFQNSSATMVAPSKQNFQPATQIYTQPKEVKGISRKIWKNDLMLGLLVTVLVLGMFGVGGYAFISYAVSNTTPTLTADSKNPFPNDNPAVTKINFGGAYQEAMTQANEARKKEKRATTKFEWEEIGNQWKRAYTLLAAIEPSNPDYAEAQSHLAEYQQNSENAYKKSSEIAANPVTVANTSPQTTTTTTSTNYPSSQTSSYPNATPTPVTKVTMPGARNNKMYIAYNTPGGYNNPSGKYVVTSDDGDFTASIGSSGAYAGAVTIRVNGGPDSCDIDFIAPRAAPLQRGTYEGAQRYPFQSPTRPGLSFDHHGQGCNELDGSFTINNIIYGADGKSIVLLDATFVQKCGSTIMGRVHYDARY